MYRAVADRVAVDLASLSVPLTQEQMREILESLHFKFLFPRIIEDLRKMCACRSIYEASTHSWCAYFC